MLRVSEDGSRRHDGHLASYRQLRKSLLDLQESADRIFDAISDRTAKESEKLRDISKRIQIAQARIDALSHSKQAITIKSSSRYPSNSVGEVDFRSLFGYKDGGAGTGFPVVKLLLNGGLNRKFGMDGTLELFQFFSESTIEHLPKEVQPKVRVDGIHSKENTSIKNLLEPPNFIDPSFVIEDHIEADYSTNLRHQSLPPPPPSLLHNLRSTPVSEGFSFRPAVKQAKSSQLENTLPKLSMSSITGLSGVDVYQPEEKMGTRGTSTQVFPCFPPPPPLPPSLPVASPTQKHQSNKGSGAKTTQIDNAESVSALPIVDSQRAALLASIRDPQIVLRKVKTGILNHSSMPITLPNSPTTGSNSRGHENIPSAHRPKSNLLAEVASSLKTRRLSMQGAFYDNEQVEGFDNTSDSTLRLSSPLAANSQESNDQSEEDDWDD